MPTAHLAVYASLCRTGCSGAVRAATLAILGLMPGAALEAYEGVFARGDAT